MTNDFDFLHGDWDAHNRRLTKRLVGCDDWDEFPATVRCHGFFDGAGNFDEITFLTKGYSGATLRLFDVEAGQWAIYWVNSRGNTLDPGVFGSFTDGVGTFYGDDTDDGTPVRVRYVWSEITPTSARWEQAFSVDGEQTWEINWIITLTRR